MDKFDDASMIRICPAGPCGVEPESLADTDDDTALITKFTLACTLLRADLSQGNGVCKRLASRHRWLWGRMVVMITLSRPTKVGNLLRGTR
jgi:hypothetical protein